MKQDIDGLVYVVWRDAFSAEDNNWKYDVDVKDSSEADEKEAIVHTVGWILLDTDHYLTIIPHRNSIGREEASHFGRISIPQNGILLRSNLTVKLK